MLDLHDRHMGDNSQNLQTLDMSGDGLFNGISEIVDEDDPKMSQTAEHSLKFKSKFDRNEGYGDVNEE